MNNLMSAICTEVLDCSTEDLSILDDCNYDLASIISDLKNDNCLSLKTVVDKVVEQAINDLNQKITDRIDDIIKDLTTLISYLPSEEDNEKEVNKKVLIIEQNDDLYSLDRCYECEWKENAEEYLDDLQKIKEHGVKYDINYYFNYLDTHVSFLAHQDTYSRFFKEEIKDVEDKLGFSFENI